jgi:glucosamine kinase
MSRRSFVLGVDGSGPRSSAIAADGLGTVLARREGANINPLTAGLENGARAVVQVIARMAEEIRCTPDEWGAVVIGVPGAEREATRTHFVTSIQAAAAKAGWKPLPLAVETDARTTLEGAFEGRSGVALIVGSGSIVIGKSPQGKIMSVGGWGRLLGDEGSGFFIGREAMVAIAQHTDHLSQATVLRNAIAGKFHWETRDEILSAVYKENFDLSTIAPVVFETAARQDIVAQRIVQKAATLLIEQARVIVMGMGITRKVAMALCGTLLDKEAVYSSVLQMKIMKLLPQVVIQKPLQSPAHGAMVLALARLGKR